MADIGIRLGVEGERDFKQAIRDINQSFKVLGSEMQLVSSQFDKNDKSIQALTARKGVLNKEIEAQKSKVDTLQSALDNASESFGENDKRTQNWQIALNKAQAELNHMERELDSTESALEGVGDEMSSAAKNTDKLETELEEAGGTADDASDKFDGLKGVLKGMGAAIGTAMAAIGAATAAAGKALYDMATKAAAAGNDVSQTAQKMGMSRQGVQEWDYILSQNGATLYHLSYGMRNLQNAMGSLDDEGGKVGKAITRLGLDFDEMRNKSPEDAMNTLVTAFQGMEDSTEKTNMALQIFGRRAGMELMPMLNSSAEATDELRQKANELGIVMSDDAIDASVGFSNSMDTLSRNFAGAKNAIGAQLLPGFTQITDGLIGLINGCDEAGEQITAGVQEVISGITTAIPQVLELFNTVATTIAEIAPEIITSLVDGIVGNLPMLMESALAIIMALLEGIIGALPTLFEGAVQVIVTLVQGISESLPQLIPAIVEAVVTMVQALIDNLPMILDAALQLVLGLTEGILNALPQLIAALPAIIIGIVDFIIGAIPQIIDAGIQLLVSLVEALPDIIAAIVEAIPQIIDGIITAVLGSIPQLIDAGIRLFMSRWGGEIIRDNFHIAIQRVRGSDNGVAIRDKKNLTGYRANVDFSTVVTRIMPQGFDGLFLPERFVDSPRIGQYFTPRIRVIESPTTAAASKTGWSAAFILTMRCFLSTANRWHRDQPLSPTTGISPHSARCIISTALARPVSWHYTTDDSEIRQHLPENEDAFHTGDGAGAGNRQSIGIEICVNSDGNFARAIDRTIELVADICRRRNIPVDNIVQHHRWCPRNKNCPQNIRAGRPINWNEFIRRVRERLGTPTPVPRPQTPVPPPAASIDAIAREVIAGRWGNGAERVRRLTDAGHDAAAVQRRVNEILRGGNTPAPTAPAPAPPPPSRLSIDELARQVIRGNWGNGADRVRRLTAAGHDAAAVQRRVNEMLR